MMTCSEVRPLLSFMIEKETGPLETLEARRHLDACNACRMRAERISSVMSGCGSLPMQAPPADLSSSVMRKLRAIKAAAAGHTDGRRATASARWSGLAVLLGAGLALLMRPAVPVLRSLGEPLAFLTGLLAGGDAPQGPADFAGHAAAVALRAVGVALKPELTSGAGIDLVVTFQLLATALSIGFLLAIPAAILTAFFLHLSTARGQLSRCQPPQLGSSDNQ